MLPQIRQFLLSRNDTPDLSLKTMPELNDFIFGIRKKELTIIGARPSEGKSTFAAQMALDLASQGHLVLFLSLEMTVEKIGARIFCYQQRFNNRNAFRGGVVKELSRFDAFEREIGGYPLIINDMLGKDWKEIDDLITHTDLRPEVIIVDYIQTIARSVRMNRLDEVDQYIRHFREMAIRKNFAGVVCSQINRSAQDSTDKRPQLHQLKQSGFLEEHADLAILLHWPYKYGDGNINRFTCFVAKNKDGQTGYIKLKFNPEYYAFEDWVQELEPAKKEIDWTE